MGQDITWVVPYQFNQRLPFDVDYKVMGTFLEFYLQLLHFLNYKMFAELGVAYPPSQAKQFVALPEIIDLQALVRTKGAASLGGEQQAAYQISEEFKNTEEVK